MFSKDQPRNWDESPGATFLTVQMFVVSEGPYPEDVN